MHHKNYTEFSILEDQLFNDHLLRLWRTGAGTEEYMTSKDKDFDISIIILHSSMIILYNSFIKRPTIWYSFRIYWKKMVIMPSVRILMLLCGKITEHTATWSQ